MRATMALSGVMLTFSTINAQSIVAGVSSVGDIYHDLVPDPSFPLQAFGYPGPSGSVELDLDQNGTPDVEFRTSGSGGSGGGSAACVVSTLSSETAIALMMDTVWSCCWDAHPLNVPDTIVSGGIIDHSLTYEPSLGLKLYYYVWGEWTWLPGAGLGAASIGTWANIGEHFIGARLTYPQDTLYCWIRVNLTDTPSPTRFYVYDHACTNSPNVGVEGPIAPTLPSLFPDPFTDRLTITLPSDSRTRLILVDMTGRPAFRAICEGRSTTVHPNVVPGPYVYQLWNEGRLVDQGKVVKY